MFRRILRILLATLPLLLLLISLPGAAFARDVWVVRRLTHSTADQYGLDISGDRLVWAEVAAVSEPYRTGGRILTWKVGDATPTALSEGPATFGDAPRVSGDRVAWAGAWAWMFEPFRHIDAGVYTWTPSAGRSVVATGAVSDVGVSGDRIAWLTDIDPTALGLHSFAVHTWQPQEGDTRLDVSRGGVPGVSEDRVAWWAGDMNAGAIYTQAKGDQAPVRVSDIIPTGSFSSPDYRIRVRVSGDRLAWAASAASGVEVFTWTPSAGVVQVTHDGYAKSTGDVSGDRIVWTASADGTRREVYTWTPSSGVIKLSSGAIVDGTPRVSGDRIVWAVGPAGSRNVYTWTPRTGTTKVTRGAEDDVDPVVSGNRVAWRAGLQGAPYQILTATLASPQSRPRQLRSAGRPALLRGR